MVEDNRAAVKDAINTGAVVKKLNETIEYARGIHDRNNELQTQVKELEGRITKQDVSHQTEIAALRGRLDAQLPIQSAVKVEVPPVATPPVAPPVAAPAATTPPPATPPAATPPAAETKPVVTPPVETKTE